MSRYLAQPQVPTALTPQVGSRPTGGGAGVRCRVPALLYFVIMIIYDYLFTSGMLFLLSIFYDDDFW